jgi:hypothetical protein
MSANRRYGGSILPEQTPFPPAPPLGSNPYNHSNPHGANGSYYQQPDPYPPIADRPSPPAPAPQRKKLNKARHGGSLLPEENFPEKPIAPADAVSVASSRSRTPSSSPPQKKRHGGTLSPEADFDNFIQVCRSSCIISVC